MATLELKNLLKQYELLNDQLVYLEEKVVKMLEEIPGAKEIISIKGVGVMTVAALLLRLVILTILIISVVNRVGWLEFKRKQFRST